MAGVIPVEVEFLYIKRRYDQLNEEMLWSILQLMGLYNELTQLLN